MRNLFYLFTFLFGLTVNAQHAGIVASSSPELSGPTESLWVEESSANMTFPASANVVKNYQNGGVNAVYTDNGVDINYMAFLTSGTQAYSKLVKLTFEYTPNTEPETLILKDYYNGSSYVALDGGDYTITAGTNTLYLYTFAGSTNACYLRFRNPLTQTFDLDFENISIKAVVTHPYDAILAEGTTQGYTIPGAGTRTAQRALIDSLDAKGIWENLDVFYMFNTDGDSDFALINWKNPTGAKATAVNSPAFTYYEGFQGNGTNAYINTNWSPLDDGVNFSTTDNMVGYYLFEATSGTGDRNFGGSASSSDGTFLSQWITSSGNISIATYDTGNSWTNWNHENGVITFLYDGTQASEKQWFHDGTVKNTVDEPTPSATSSYDYFIGAGSNNGSPAWYSTFGYGAFWAGASMRTDQAELNTQLNYYFQRDLYLIQGNSDETVLTSATGTDDARGQQFTATEDMYVQELSVYHNAADNANELTMSIYSDTGSNEPGTLLGHSHPQNGIKNGWNTLPLLDEVYIASGTKYWVIYAGNQLNVKYASNGSAYRVRSVEQATTYDAVMPETFNVLDVSNFDYSVYASYTTHPKPVQDMTFVTRSRLATWSPQTITKTGATITWTARYADGTLVDSDTANDPTLDLSGNTGQDDIYITAHSGDGWTGLTWLDLWVPNDTDGGGSHIHMADIRPATSNLTYLNFRYCHLEDAVWDHLTGLTDLTVRGREQMSYNPALPPSQAQLDFFQYDGVGIEWQPSLAGYTSLATVRYYDIAGDALPTWEYMADIIEDLDDSNVSNGELTLYNTSDPNISVPMRALDDYLSLQGKGWTVDAAFHIDLDDALNHDQQLDVAAQTPEQIYWANDKLYVVDGGLINQWTMGPADDVDLASDDAVSQASSQTRTGFQISPDGTKIVAGNFSNPVDNNGTTMSTAWDLSTSASYTSHNPDLIATEARGWYWKPDGTEMYVLDYTNLKILTYTLGTAWTGTATADTAQDLDISTYAAAPAGLLFSPDGRFLYYLNRTGDSIDAWRMTTAWDPSTAAFYQNYNDTDGITSTPYDLAWGPGYTTILILDTTLGEVASVKLNNNEVLDVENIATPDLSSSTGWTLANGTTITGGEAVINTATTYAYPLRSSGMTLVDNAYYLVEWDITNYTSGSIRVSFNGTAAGNDKSQMFSANGSYKYLLRHDEQVDDLIFSNGSSGSVMNIDNVSVKLAYTDNTDILTNGSFEYSGVWVLSPSDGGGSATIADGGLTIISDGTYKAAYQDAGITASSTYAYEVDITVNSGTATMNLGDDSTATVNFTTSGTHKGVLTVSASPAGPYVYIKRNGAANFTVDRVKIIKIN